MAPLNICLTGGTSGIGLQVCKSLLDEGHHVWLTCRTKARGAQIATSIPPHQQKQVTTVECDLSSLDSVRQATQELQQLPHLDVLILNAGLIKNQRTDTNGLEANLLVNHLSQFLLAHQLWPLLMKAPNPRVVITSSELQKRAQASAVWSLLQWSPALKQLVPAGVQPPPAYKAFQAYAVSKRYNVWTALSLAQRGGSKLWTASVTPGWVPATELTRESFWLGRMAMKYLMPWLPMAVSVPEGARRILHVAVSPDAPAQAPSGSYWSRGQPNLQPADLAQDEAAAQQLWDISIKALGLEDLPANQQAGAQ